MVPSVYLGFLCVQVSSVCDICPTQGMKVVIYSGSLVHCAAGREDHGKQTSLVRVGRARGVWATLGSPLTACVLSPSTLLRLQLALQGAV